MTLSAKSCYRHIHAVPAVMKFIGVKLYDVALLVGFEHTHLKVSLEWRGHVRSIYVDCLVGNILTYLLSEWKAFGLDMTAGRYI